MNASGQLVLWLGEQLGFPQVTPIMDGRRLAMPAGAASWERFANWIAALDPATEADVVAGSAALDAIDEAWLRIGRPPIPTAPQFTTESGAAA